MSVGHAKNSKSYKFLDLKSNGIMGSKDVEFLETSFLSDSSKL